MALNIGETVGDYRVLDLLGVGGMGSVYRVQNVITDREEAMKVLLPDLRSAPELAERFGREIKIHASLEHPNIASLRTALRLDNQLLMVMELVNGITLEKRLRQSPVELWQGVDWVIQILSALSYAHGRGVIHRDIKPANVMITPANIIKLTDFGIASMAAEERRLTRTGVAIGSLPYMSPEQIRADEPDARSDLYSLGVTFYEMLSGRRAFEGKSEYELMRAQLELQPTPLSSFNPGLPHAIVTAVERAMAKQPENRFQTAQEFQIALERAKQPLLSSEPSRPAPFQTPAPATTSLDPARIERLRKELAQYVGPMARILVDRAAKKAVSLQQLYEMVAAEIPKPKDRESFLTNRGR